MSDPYEQSLKQDIVPVIASLLGTDPAPLFDLSVEVLNKLFEVTSSGLLPAPKVTAILQSTSDPATILEKLEAGAENAPSPYRYDEAADLRAGIVAMMPDPTAARRVQEALAEVSEVRRLTFLTTLQPYQVLSELGLSTEQARPAPPTPGPGIPQGHPAGAGPAPSAGSSSPPASTSTPAPGGNQAADAQATERDEQARALTQEIVKYLSKRKYKEEARQWQAVLERMHPDDLERGLKLMKKLKKEPLRAFAEYVVVTHQIEEIDVDVQHWQGVRIAGGAAVGGYRAGIPFRRYDRAVAEMDAELVAQFAEKGKSVLQKLHSNDYATFKDGADWAKILAREIQREL